MTATATKSTLAYRAAVYFGWQHKPRTSIKLDPSACLIVGEVGRRTIFMHYDEEFEPKGTYISLTDRQCEKLRDALFFGGSHER